jgi:hypothetical protein
MISITFVRWLIRIVFAFALLRLLVTALAPSVPLLRPFALVNAGDIVECGVVAIIAALPIAGRAYDVLMARWRVNDQEVSDVE